MLKSIKIFFRHLILKKQLRTEKSTKPKINFGKKNILIIDEHIPEFDKDSGSRRMTEIIKILVKNGFKVFLLANQKEYKYNKTYIPYFEKMGVTVYKPYLENNELITKEKFINHIAPKLKWAILSRPDIFNNYHNQLRKLNDNCTLIYDMVDFHYIRFLREYELNNSESTIGLAKKYKQIEKENCTNADITIAVSNKDRDYLDEANIKPKSVKVISNIHQPNSDLGTAFIDRKDLLFIGGFKHAPNIDAVKILYNIIMPLIWKKSPEIKLHVVGSHVPDEIKSLQSDKFVIHGFVENVDPFFNSCKVFIAPLQYGAGIKGKIGQSFEYNLPVVTTEIGLEGFNFHEYEKYMLATIGEDFADKTLEIYNNETLWKDINKNCKTILTPFSIESTETVLLETLI